jgi:hypothetical protein
MQAKNSNHDITAECDAKYIALRTLGFRATFLFMHFGIPGGIFIY